MLFARFLFLMVPTSAVIRNAIIASDTMQIFFFISAKKLFCLGLLPFVGLCLLAYLHSAVIEQD